MGVRCAFLGPGLPLALATMAAAAGCSRGSYLSDSFGDMPGSVADASASMMDAGHATTSSVSVSTGTPGTAATPLRRLTPTQIAYALSDVLGVNISTAGLPPLQVDYDGNPNPTAVSSTELRLLLDIALQAAHDTNQRGHSHHAGTVCLGGCGQRRRDRRCRIVARGLGQRACVCPSVRVIGRAKAVRSRADGGGDRPSRHTIHRGTRRRTLDRRARREPKPRSVLFGFARGRSADDVGLVRLPLRA